MLVSEIYIYPVKSFGGISLQSAAVTDRGLQYDRRWMLVDESGRFLTQRELPALALLQVAVNDHYLTIQHKQATVPPLTIPIKPEQVEMHPVTIWTDRCEAINTGKEAATWFFELLGVRCNLVYMPEQSMRRVDPIYALNNEITNFSDGYPFMMIGQASLDDLNKRLPVPLPTNRFRPNIVFSGGQPYQEDELKSFKIGTISFFGVKRCGRCVIITIDQENLSRGKEPLKTLAGYRTEDNTVFFGQNLLHRGEGRISVGDRLEVIYN
ncbi:MAG: MOSC N-terminal beta barrel domain-containing protein [Chitinophagaceae bacterium]